MYDANLSVENSFLTEKGGSRSAYELERTRSDYLVSAKVMSPRMEKGVRSFRRVLYSQKSNFRLPDSNACQ